MLLELDLHKAIMLQPSCCMMQAAKARLGDGHGLQQANLERHEKTIGPIYFTLYFWYYILYVLPARPTPLEKDVS